MIAKIRNYIFTGLLVVLPLILSITILWWIFIKITNIVFKLLPYALKTNPVWGIVVRLTIPLALLVVLALVGMIAKFVFIRKIFGLGENLLIKIPFFSKIYITVKQISQAFLATGKTIFRRVVLVEYPRKGIHSIGFVTSRAKNEIKSKTKGEMINIFVPTTPNPTSGILIVSPPDEVIELDMSVEDGMKFVISGGTVVPPYGTSQNTPGR